MLVDSHCHLDFPDFQDDTDDVISRARDAGVGMMLTICTHLSKFAQVRAVAEKYDNVYCTVGIHPHEADNEELPGAKAIIEKTKDDKVAGIGETGLDFFYEHSPRKEQEESFRTHLEAARETGLPIVVHTREADEDTIRILKDEAEKGPFRGVIHCFSTGRAVAEAALDLGLYISLSGIVTFKKAEGLRDIVKDLPLERVLVETDAPFLAPVPYRGKRNEPSYVPHTAACVAEVMGVAEKALEEATTENFFRLFSKCDRERLEA